VGDAGRSPRFVIQGFGKKHGPDAGEKQVAHTSKSAVTVLAMEVASAAHFGSGQKPPVETPRLIKLVKPD
jgi:hypothetical protein